MAHESAQNGATPGADLAGPPAEAPNPIGHDSIVALVSGPAASFGSDASDALPLIRADAQAAPDSVMSLAFAGIGDDLPAQA
jgi:hypothetical protein